MGLMTAGMDDDDEGGCYFVDQKGNYYFQASEDAELTAVENANADFDLMDVQQKNDEEEVNYVLITNEDGNKTMVVNNTGDGELGDAKDNEIYDFDDPDYIVQEEDTKGQQTRTKRGQSSAGSTYMCNYCNYTSNKLFLLSRHLKTHSEDRPHKFGNKPVFQCKLCPTTCGRKTDLRIHVQNLHTADKPIKCKRCESTFTDRYSYKMHAKTHEGEKCYRCDFCPYASISMRHLESHLLLHTDQKPYKCEQCAQNFRQKQLLKRHINYYHNPDYVAPTPKAKTHLCPTCGRTFRHKGNLIRHMALHDPDSSVHEELLALREGRQKKVRIILEEEEYKGEEDYDEEDMEDEEEDEDEDDEAEDEEEVEMSRMQTSDMVTVEDDDGQYVVLEVIQLQDKDIDKTTAVKPKGKRAATKRKVVTAAAASATSSKPATTTSNATAISATALRMQKALRKQLPLQQITEEPSTLDVDDIDLALAEEEGENNAQEIIIEQSPESDDEFLLSTEDLQDTEMLMSSLQSTKRPRFAVTISQEDLEKNMSNCFGFDDDDDEDLDTKATITLLN
uniref:C2H2-type domain-containing protein n=1 Tax=Anopheles dirus TaxID=7168 RepID=A0A182NM51_9DIPT